MMPLRQATNPFPAALVWLAILGAPALLRAAAPAADLEFFETRIRPLLAENCFKCHSETSEKLKGGLHLDTRAGMLKGGESGPSLVPGQPDESRLIQAVRYKDEKTAMPPKKKLADAQIADLEAWVRLGSSWPEQSVAPAAVEGKKGYDWKNFAPGIGRSAKW